MQGSLNGRRGRLQTFTAVNFSNEATLMPTVKSIAIKYGYGDSRILVKSKSSWKSPKVNLLCTISQTKNYVPLVFEENTVIGTSYLGMLHTWIFQRLREHSDNFIMRTRRRYVTLALQRTNDTLPQRWMGRTRLRYTVLYSWFSRSPDFPQTVFYSTVSSWNMISTAVASVENVTLCNI